MGRNADYILREFDHTLRVFVHADKYFRIRHMQELMPDATRDQIEKDMLAVDRARQDFCTRYTGHLYADSRNYDLTLNTGKLGFDKAYELLLAAAKDIK